ncbi:uncharacterized protein LACBIDRAFT_329734 [Laccaria bicolor S238N-H82]|uniref:Predicted protein n=1 Tax=Laccaria bicolor (strain S238N-H82 / ATCC MYA-4686) TaxID=486041 RepID=B0DJ25_LACBS|nr:uncharacterized protein LACBIDRAFT_329734 [Laccaria bicolor S238N-H82]EDR05448.1 predicted protein [Laccaria bicolor S238N-H82]|eukprot:XP_001884006.1 predicted protein [Laccaria bicolor S238N-H82]
MVGKLAFLHPAHYTSSFIITAAAAHYTVTLRPAKAERLSRLWAEVEAKRAIEQIDDERERERLKKKGNVKDNIFDEDAEVRPSSTDDSQSIVPKEAHKNGNHVIISAFVWSFVLLALLTAGVIALRRIRALGDHTRYEVYILSLLVLRDNSINMPLTNTSPYWMSIPAV